MTMPAKTCLNPEEPGRPARDDCQEAGVWRLLRHTETCPACRAALGDLMAGCEVCPGQADPFAADTVATPHGAPGRARRPGVPTLPGYEVLGELGRGGMGVVYRARQVGAGRVVALKMILAGTHAGADALSRFRAEAKIIARLRHPNIVQVFEFGQHGGLPYFAMEFCAGGSLKQQLAGAPLPPGEAAALVERLARAMHAAHEQGVVHRDLKPANVLLGEGGTPKVSDFGLAKRLGGAALTLTGAVLGTPSYMAPEQASGHSKEVGPSADVYALGAILYELLTGRPPFRAATPLETLHQVCARPPLAPRSLDARVPHDLDTVCLTCLRKKPQHRYASAWDLAEDLCRWRSGGPVAPRPAGRLVRWARLSLAALRRRVIFPKWTCQDRG
jgi:serine/threonine-protein kinase